MYDYSYDSNATVVPAQYVTVMLNLIGLLPL